MMGWVNGGAVKIGEDAGKPDGLEEVVKDIVGNPDAVEEVSREIVGKPDGVEVTLK